jgi:hypothetical protein
MARQQVPTAVVVVAILHFILGGIGLLSSLCGGIALAVGGGDIGRLFAFNPEMQQQIETQQRVVTEHAPFYVAWQVEGFVVGLVLSALLVTAGVGLLRLRSWARSFSLVYAVVDILQTLLAASYTFVFYLPAYQEAVRQTHYRTAQEAEIARVTAQSMGIGMAFGFLLTLAYPVVVLVIMLLPSVAAAFRGETVRKEPEDYRDPDEPGGFTEPDDRFRTGGR